MIAGVGSGQRVAARAVRGSAGWAIGATALMAGAAAGRASASRRASGRRLALQTAVADVLAEELTLEDTTRRVLGAMGEALELALAAAWRADPAGRELRFVDLWSSPAVDAEWFRQDSLTAVFRPGEGLLGRAWAAGRPLVVDAVSTQRGVARAGLLRSLGLRCVVFVPIVMPHGAGGVIECFTDRPTGMDAATLDLIEHIGRQIGVAYQRAEWLAQLEESEHRRRRVMSAMLRAEEDARSQLASDLHDDTIQVMAATLLSLERVSAACRAGDLSRIGQAAESAIPTLRSAIERARHLMFELRPEVLAEQGLRQAAQLLLEDAAEQAGFHFRLEAPVGRYSRGIENLCYRTLQEAISNVRRHSRAGRVEVRLSEHDGLLEGEVRDDGVGFDPHSALDRRRMRLHLGLEAMRERVGVAGGELAIDAQPGEGARVAFSIPLSAAEPGAA
jgi:signal transduction histidine kinase